MDKTLLLNLIEREQNYFDSQESGSEEYVNSKCFGRSQSRQRNCTTYYRISGYYGSRKRHNVYWFIERVYTILSSKEKLKTDPKTRGYGNITSCFSHKKHIPL